MVRILTAPATAARALGSAQAAQVSYYQLPSYQRFPRDKRGANIRQMLGRPGEAWGGESGTDRLVVVRD